MSTENTPLPLLSFRMSTRPGPLQASTPNAPVNARINIAVSQFKDTTAFCNRIRISIPIGEESDCFSAHPPAVSVNTTKWAVDSSVNSPGGKVRYAVYQISARDENDYRINYDLQISIDGIANTNAGQFELLIHEHSGSTTDDSSYEWRSMKMGVSKATPEFFLHNFIARASSAYSVPCTEFRNGADVHLAWESNGTWFQVFRKNEAKAIWEGNATHCELKGDAKNDTTYVLSACVIGTSGGDTSSNFQPIYLYDALTITVSDPVLTPKSVSVAADLTVAGTTTIKKLQAQGDISATGNISANTATVNNHTVNGTLTVQKNSALKATVVDGALTVAQLADLYSVQIKTQITAATANITALTVTGNSSLNSVTAASLKVSGDFNLEGAGKLFHSVEVVGAGEYTAECDLLVTASVSAWEDKSRNDGCYAIVSIQTGECNVYANGGNLSGPPGWTGYNFHGSCSAIVRKGAKYKLAVSDYTNIKAATAFYRWKLGWSNK